jgi:hypothetical protein
MAFQQFGGDHRLRDRSDQGQAMSLEEGLKSGVYIQKGKNHIRTMVKKTHCRKFDYQPSSKPDQAKMKIDGKGIKCSSLHGTTLSKQDGKTPRHWAHWYIMKQLHPVVVNPTLGKHEVEKDMLSYATSVLSLLWMWSLSHTLLFPY